MSATAVDARLGRTLRFYDTTIGKKAVVAVTGAAMFGFLIAHMVGNLQVFAGDNGVKMDEYAISLRKLGPALWAARLGLLVSVVLHIVATVQLWRGQQAARPTGYAKKVNEDSSYASRTMKWSGPIIALFVIYHLMHFTWVVFPGYEHLRPYENLVRGFQNPAISIVYIVAMVMVCMHLNHGLWSMFQTLGFNHPRYTPMLKTFAVAFSTVIAAGFIAVPVAVLTGIVS